MTSRIDDLDNAEELWKTSPALKDEPKPLSQQGRVRSWEKVVVFVEANDALYIAEKDRIRDSPRETLSLPLVQNKKDVFIYPRDQKLKVKADGQYVATVKLNKLKNFRVQRLLGKITELYVFECPPRVIPETAAGA